MMNKNKVNRIVKNLRLYFVKFSMDRFSHIKSEGSEARFKSIILPLNFFEL